MEKKGFGKFFTLAWEVWIPEDSKASWSTNLNSRAAASELDLDDPSVPPLLQTTRKHEDEEGEEEKEWNLKNLEGGGVVVVEVRNEGLRIGIHGDDVAADEDPNNELISWFLTVFLTVLF